MLKGKVEICGFTPPNVRTTSSIRYTAILQGVAVFFCSTEFSLILYLPLYLPLFFGEIRCPNVLAFGQVHFLYELEDLSFLNEVDRHYEHSELTENSLYDRAAKPTESVEEAVMKKLQYEALHRAIQELPLVQRRRLVLYYFQGLTYSQIAELEGCKYQTVQESIYAALKKLKLFLK